MSSRIRKHHSLKTDPIPFSETVKGRKPWEIRKNDRDFCEGDTVTLHETVSSGAELKHGAVLEYTGRTWQGLVEWVLYGPQYGLADGWCIFGVVPVSAGTPEAIPKCDGNHAGPPCRDAECWTVPHASLEVMGNIQVDEGGELQSYYKALVITFDSTDDIRTAIDLGRCTFSFKEGS